jgi:hypothetical protein
MRPVRVETGKCSTNSPSTPCCSRVWGGYLRFDPTTKANITPPHAAFAVVEGLFAFWDVHIECTHEHNTTHQAGLGFSEQTLSQMYL